MIEALKDIGEIRLQNHPIYETLIKSVEPFTSKKEKRYIIGVNLNTAIKKIETKVLGEISKESGLEYFNFGHRGGANTRQWLMTFDSLGYLSTEVVSELLSMRIPDLLRKDLEMVLKDFFYDFKNITKDKKYRYILRLDKSKIIDYSIEKAYTNSKLKDVQKNIISDFEKKIYENYELKKAQIGLYTLMIDDIPIAKRRDYRNFIASNLDYSHEGNSKKSNSYCALCGNLGKVDKADFSIKIFTTNQNSFASDLNTSNYRLKNLGLCIECANKISAGENFVIGNMQTKIAGLDCYIIPHMILGEKIAENDLVNISGKILNGFNESINIKSVEKFKNGIEDILEDNSEKGFYFLLNLVFYKKKQASTKIRTVIKDVNPSIFLKFGEAFANAQSMCYKYFSYGGKNGFSVVINTIPTISSDGDIKEYRILLSLLRDIFELKQIDKKHLIKVWNNGVRIIRFNREEYWIAKHKKKLHYHFSDIMYSYLFLKTLKLIDCERSVYELDVIKDLKEELKDFIKDMNLTEEMVGLFLLGYLINQIGSKQNKDSEQGTYKPIMNKINFNGMDFKRIQMLSSEVYKKLREVKVLEYNEKNCFVVSNILGKNRDSWSLDKEENLFYLLMGVNFRYKKESAKNE